MSEHQERITRILSERDRMWSPGGRGSGSRPPRRSGRPWWSGPSRAPTRAHPVRLAGAGSVTGLAPSQTPATDAWATSGSGRTETAPALLGLSEAVARRVRPAGPRRENEEMGEVAAFMWGAHTGAAAQRAQLAGALLRRPVSLRELDQD